MKKTIEKENYLKTIYKMEERAERITVTGLSLNFNVSKSTVSNMVKKLVVMGLVDSKPYEPIYLTTKGSQKEHLDKVPKRYLLTGGTANI